MSLPDRASQVLDRMVQAHLGERPLFFICHSLGGLLVKQILRKADDADDDPRRKQVATNTRAVLFLATPHAGATLASLLNAFRQIFGTTVSIDDLRAHDPHLRDLYDWYRKHSDGLDIKTVTYFETRPFKGVTIVSPTSAQAGVGADAVGLDEDHLSIAKPRDRDAQVCDAARDLLRNCVLTHRVVLSPPSQRIDFGRDGHPIPCELPPPAEEHFGRLTELRMLTDRLRAGKNSAVVGPAGYGKTALAAKAVRAVVGDAGDLLAASPFPDGVVFLDLYTYRGQSDPAWNNLANTLAGAGFMQKSTARERAIEACRASRILIIIEGAEEADGKDGRASIDHLCEVFSPQNRRLLLTRNSSQAVPAESVALTEALHPSDAATLLDSLTQRSITGTVRDQVLALLEGHPLALTWAGNLLARSDDDPEHLVRDWEADAVRGLTDPVDAEHSLQWLFNRSVRGLDDSAHQILAAAGLMARAPFPLAAMLAALGPVPDATAITREALKSLVQRGLLRMGAEGDQWEFTHVLGYRFARKETGSDLQLRERLGRWLGAHIQALIADTTIHQRMSSLTVMLEHAAALLRTDDNQRLWSPLATSFLYQFADRLTNLGRLDMVGLTLRAVAEWMGRFPPAQALEPTWLRERSVLLNRQADIAYDKGDLARALETYRESMDLSRRLTESDPSDTGWQHDLTITQERIGNVLFDQGDLDGALKTFRESLDLRRNHAQADLSNAGWQRDLSVSLTKVGDVLRNKGDRDGALTAYRESLDLCRRLAETDPSNMLWQSDLSVHYERIGTVLLDQDDMDGALKAFRESLDLRRRLAEADPSNATWKRDLSVSHNKVGDVLRNKGDRDGALTAFQEALDLRLGLAEADPSNAVWQRDLSVSLDKVADVLRDQGDMNGSMAASLKALELRRRLAETDPSNAGWQRDLSLSLTRMAQLNERLGRRDEALSLAENSLDIDERLAALDRSNVLWQEDVRISRALVARLRGEQSVDSERVASV